MVTSENVIFYLTIMVVIVPLPITLRLSVSVLNNAKIKINP